MTLEEPKDKIQSQIGVLLYFSGEECGVCHVLRPKFAELFNERFSQIEQVYIDAHQNPEISAYFQVFSVPTMIVFMGGNEFAREGRLVSLHQLSAKLERPYSMLTGE